MCEQWCSQDYAAEAFFSALAIDFARGKSGETEGLRGRCGFPHKLTQPDKALKAKPHSQGSMGWMKLGALAAGLAVWYSMHGAPSNYAPAGERYKLSPEIRAVNTTLPYEKKERTLKDSSGETVHRLENVIKTNDIDLSDDFVIKTERYRVVKDNDWLPSRMVGHLMSIPAKLYFWDRNVHRGLDVARTYAVLAMLESNENLEGITVRINHNEAMYDWWRMMTEQDLRNKSPFLYRLSVGTLVAIKDELLAELGRSDYYNPLTQIGRAHV